jgi:pimeloyl-CoA synthetase
MNILENFLKKVIQDKSLIGIRTKELEWGQTIIGYIIDLNETYFTINEIDEYGTLIGNTIIEIDDVLHIEHNDRYQRRLQMIFDNRLIFNSNNRVTIWKEGKKLTSHLKILKEKNILSTFFLNENDYVIGFLLDFTEDHLFINNIGDEGDEDGVSCYCIEDFIGLRYNSLFEQKTKLLYENRNVFYL